MRNQGLILIGVVLIAAGLMFLLGNLFDINLGAYCFPVGLILLGVFLMLRPRMVAPGTRSDVLLIGDLDRSGTWDVTDEEVWAFIGDINYDLTKASIPKGDTTIRVTGFINDVEIFALGERRHLHQCHLLHHFFQRGGAAGGRELPGTRQVAECQLRCGGSASEL